MHRLSLVVPTLNLRKILEVTGLTASFDIYSSVAEAVSRTGAADRPIELNQRG